MEDRYFYKKIAEAVFLSENSNCFKGKGRTHITLEGELYNIDYMLMELEGYEEPCYDVDSSRCGPGGYYGLDTFVFENIWVSTVSEEDIDIDLRELSFIYNENDSGGITFEKEMILNNYYESL